MPLKVASDTWLQGNTRSTPQVLARLQLLRTVAAARSASVGSTFLCVSTAKTTAVPVALKAINIPRRLTTRLQNAVQAV